MATGTLMESARVFQAENGFQWAFWIGVLMIPTVKLIAQGAPILGGCVAAALGILIMWRYKSDQVLVRPEREQPRLGDEVYYLGLLYTLTSLCAALVSLFLLDRPDQTLERRTDEMIGSFGIALLTTMAGIVMRMALQRHAPEGQEMIIRVPTDIQGVTLDLDRYAHELRRQLESSANAFASHANKTILQAKTTHAHMDELMQTFHDGLKEKANTELARLQEIHKSVAHSADEALRQTVAQHEGIQTALQGLQAHVTAMDESIERIRVGSADSAENLGAIAAIAKESVQVGEDWMILQRQASSALGEVQQTTQEVAKLGHEAQRTSAELATLPNGLRRATTAIEQLAEVTAASNAISNLEINATAVTQHLAGIAGACKRHHEALDATVEKLQALAETAGQEFEGQAKLREAIAELSEVAATATEYTQSLKSSEREIQAINTGLNGVQTALRDKGIELAEGLRAAIAALEEARRRDTGVLRRLWRG